jgi:type II secretory ATPase GspE/PulE/Tfp pilus assembly ATPase PilB-like protein
LGWFKSKKQPQIVEPPIKFIPKGQLPEFDPELYVNVRVFVAAALTFRAESLLMIVTPQKTATFYQVDAVPLERETLDPQTGASFAAVIKIVAGIDISKRVAQQQGDFEIVFQRRKYNCTVTSQLSNEGEKLLLKFAGEESKPPERLDACGMTDKQLERVKELLAGPGIVVVSAPPKQGFTTTFNATMHAVDRYLRNAVIVEPEGTQDPQVENVEPTYFDPKKNETPATVLPKLLRTYPDVVCLRHLADAETAQILFTQPENDRLVVVGIPARDAVEAVLRILALKAPRDKFVDHLKLVLNQRLLRKLCDECKERFAPPPQLLQQLGIPQGRIAAFYRQGAPKLPPEQMEKLMEAGVPIICPSCQGIGYRGRTALFEMLIPDDTLRKGLRSINNVEELRKFARKSGHKSLLDEGIVLAARGVTSVQEVLRVLKS